MKTFQQPTGSVMKETPSGHNVMDLAGSTNNIAGLANVNWNQVIGSRYDESEFQAKREMEAASKDYGKSLSAGTSKILGYDSSYSKGTSANEVINKTMTTEQKQAADYATGVIDRIAKENHISSSDVLNMAAYAKAGVEIAGTGGGVSITGSTESKKTEAWNAVKDALKEQKFSESLSTVETYGKTISNQKNEQESDTVIDSMRSDFNESQSASSRKSIAQEKLRSIQESRSNYENRSNAIDLNLNNQFTNWGMQKFGAANFEAMVVNDSKKTREAAELFLKESDYGVSQYILKDIQDKDMSVTNRDKEAISNNKTANDSWLNSESGGAVKNFQTGKVRLQQDYENANQNFGQHIKSHKAELQSKKDEITNEHKSREDQGIEKTNQLASQQFGDRIINTVKDSGNNASKVAHNFFNNKRTSRF